MLDPARESLASRDDALMARLAARDAVCFREVIDLYGRKAHAIAWRMLGDASEAEDMAQEAMLKLWNHAGSWIAGGQGIGPWLARVTTNLCLDRLRRIRHSPARMCLTALTKRRSPTPNSTRRAFAN